MSNESSPAEPTRILVVEDENVVAMDLKHRLEKQGFKVCGIAGQRAVVLEMVEATAPDLVLMDIVLQGEVDGIAVAHEVREHYDIPVVFLTANSDLGTIQRAKATVPYGYLIKPFEERELLATIEMAVYRHQLEAEQRLYARAMAASATSIVVTDARRPDHPIIFCNPAFEHTTGYSAAHVMGRNCRFMQGPDTDIQTIATLRDAVQDGRECRVTILNYRRDGTPIWLELLIAPVSNSAGQITHYVGVQKDVTVEKQAAERIREQAELLDEAHDAIIVKDLQGKVLYWNKGAERIYGWTAAEAMGQGAFELLSHGDPPDLSEANQLIMEQGAWSGQLTLLTKEGKTVQIESSWTLLKDDLGKPKANMIIGTDITAKKQLEAQVLRMQRMESIGTLAGGIAHDLNNVFGPIVLGLELLQKQMPDKRSQHLLDLLGAAAQRGANIVKQILSFARGVEGERAAVHIGNLVAEQERICNNTFPKTIHIRTDLADSMWTVMGDATQLHQVLMNLCVNARDAMSQGGTLTIRSSNVILEERDCRLHPGIKPGPFVMVSIEDTGTGIPPHVMERIFDPFFTTKEVGKGTGLGLSTVLGIMKSHGGFIDADSVVGSWSQFRVYLPAMPGADTVLPSSVKRYGIPRGNGERILLVDDEPTVRELTRSTLEENGYLVTTACDGTEAVVALAEQLKEIKAVITDMSMPFMDGPATIRALEKMNPNLKFIAISGMMGNAVPGDLVHFPKVKFLQKPFPTETLLFLLAEVIAGGAAPAPLAQNGTSPTPRSSHLLVTAEV